MSAACYPAWYPATYVACCATAFSAVVRCMLLCMLSCILYPFLRCMSRCRELHRLREEWQGRGKGQSLAALAGQSAASPRGQPLQQLRPSLLAGQQSRPQTPSGPGLPRGHDSEEPLGVLGQGRWGEPNSPTTRSCSPRCRVAKGNSFLHTFSHQKVCKLTLADTGLQFELF